MRYSRSGMRMNHMNDEIKRANSQINAEKIKSIIFMGSSVIVVKNIAIAGPNATSVHPINSGSVILCALLFYHSIFALYLLISLKNKNL